MERIIHIPEEVPWTLVFSKGTFGLLGVNGGYRLFLVDNETLIRVDPLDEEEPRFLWYDGKELHTLTVDQLSYGLSGVVHGWE